MTHDNPQPANFATVRDGRVLLWRTGWNSPVCTVVGKAQSAIVYGDELVVQFLDGTSTLYRITPSRTSAYVVRRLC